MSSLHTRPNIALVLFSKITGMWDPACTLCGTNDYCNSDYNEMAVEGSHTLRQRTQDAMMKTDGEHQIFGVRLAAGIHVYLCRTLLLTHLRKYRPRYLCKYVYNNMLCDKVVFGKASNGIFRLG